MPRKAKRPYTCPCCGYETSQKNDMKKHFYKVLKPCPKQLNNIDLTEDIKQFVLANRIYHHPKNETPSLTQTININNTVVNYIANMDVLGKLQKYVDYKNLELVDFEKYVEQRYAKINNKLQTNSIKYIEFKRDDFLELIDEVTNILNGKSMEYFNMMYDSRINKLAIYSDETWEEYLLNTGVKRIINIIKEFYLDSYEVYLIHSIETSSEFKRQQSIELLEEYYKFLGCFDIKPSINVDDENVYTTYMKRYKQLFEKITKSESNHVRKEVLDIIKRNSVRNIDEMNNYIMELLNADEKFKSVIITQSF